MNDRRSETRAQTLKACEEASQLENGGLALVWHLLAG